MPVKLIIDSDPGIGDAVAVALAVLDPEIELLAITGVAGRVSGDQATRNLHGVLSVLDPSRWPRIGCGEGPAFFWPPEPGSIEPVLLHGPQGVGELDVPNTGLHQKHDSCKVMCEIVRAHPQEVTILTLGPLTNLERAAELWPEFWESVHDVVCLGGALNGPGDVTAAAEFNIFADPEAAHAFLRSAVTKTLIPLEVARHLQLSFEQYTRLNNDKYSRVGQLLERTLPFALRSHRQHLGKEVLWMPEIAALASISQSRSFERETMAVDVELQGQLTRGMTIADRRPTSQWRRNTDVATRYDVRSVLDWMTRLLARG
ncbi:Pyrimidine-specific ribonucleoside hydrolase RihA [Caulifigura coniformis]|uniref:Pyrimidine-specific ribonucleoside hydrolase RihA n=1 Tax=Caulifigura coniformis TaxID=2527983 RepID=A0A517S960_9PLAN|nr:nucleoside hydrolase [Caulifigura coniformis]QDT52668.1 Pyrimidine-specific ribonucleoside hydrolase RihA [Caulifigura coniformis]